VRHVEENRVSLLAHDAAAVAERERRLELLDVELRDVELAAEPATVRVREPHVRQEGVDPRPAICVRQPFRGPADDPIRVRQVPADRAVALRAAERVVRFPRARDGELPVANADRVEDDEVPEAAPRYVGAPWPVLPEDPLEVPVAVGVLAQAHDRVLDGNVSQEHAAIDEVARVVVQ
jgi:hypothetical protein